MTWDEAHAALDLLAAELSDAVNMQPLTLTKAERDVLLTLPDEITAKIEAILAKYTPSGEDVRIPIVQKALAQIILKAPGLLKAARIGYEVQGA